MESADTGYEKRNNIFSFVFGGFFFKLDPSRLFQNYQIETIQIAL